MDKTTNFLISLSGYEIEGLIGIDAPRTMPLYHSCSDYVVLERGYPPNTASAHAEFENCPPMRDAAAGLMPQSSSRAILTGIDSSAGMLEGEARAPNENQSNLCFQANCRKRG
ncbi:hypothetical protein ACDY97_00355 [Rhizobium mongolense]|uniref:hypothetical protein n=1 Tax=Rhizobium TaxID=379 RepID=UPI0024B083FB|nr:hypothetical protein [Rhizobium sp. CC1099]WFU91728.1 hypothetical protein QA644_26755 [Rhizobium sp. CC1099]